MVNITRVLSTISFVFEPPNICKSSLAESLEVQHEDCPPFHLAANTSIATKEISCSIKEMSVSADVMAIKLHTVQGSQDQGMISRIDPHPHPIK